jgi:hypothetical protein
MRKKVILAVLSILLLLSLVFNVIMMFGLGTKEIAEDTYLVAVVGQPREEVTRVLGKPDMSLSGFYGDIYNIGTHMLTIYYDAESRITYARISDDNGTTWETGSMEQTNGIKNAP